MQYIIFTQENLSAMYWIVFHLDMKSYSVYSMSTQSFHTKGWHGNLFDMKWSNFKIGEVQLDASLQKRIKLNHLPLHVWTKAFS